MAALDRASLANYSLNTISPDVFKAIVRNIVWDLFYQIKDNSIKFRIWGIPISLKVSTFQDIITQLVGPRV